MQDDSTGFVVCEICSQVSHKTCENASELEEIASVIAIDFAITSFQSKNICSKCQDTVKKFRTFKMQLIKSEDECSSDSDIIVKAECNVETEVCKLCKNNMDIAELQPIASAVDKHSFQDLMLTHFPEIHVSVPDAQLCKTCIQWLEDFKVFTLTLQSLRSKLTDMKCEIIDNNIEDIKIKTEFDIKSELDESMDTESDLFAETDSKIKIEESDMLDENSRRSIKKEYEDMLGGYFKKQTKNLSIHRKSLKLHPLLHRNPPKVQRFKCSECTFETNQKKNLISHIDNIPQKVEVDECTVEAKHKSALKTRDKRNLKRHTLVHKDQQKVEIGSRDQRSLKIFSLGYKNPLEIGMFNCKECTYQTRRLINLKVHELSHKNPQEPKIFKCKECTYKTIHKGNLKIHTLIHKHPQEIEMFKCSDCTFETKRKNALEKHKLVHKDPQEIEIFQCTECAFETKHKYYLKTHALVHRTLQEIETFKCTECAFETKQKGNLKRHSLMH